MFKYYKINIKISNIIYMSKTKKEVLKKLYNEFYNEINNIVNVKDVFPNLKEMDIIDIIFLLNHYFGMTTNYKQIVKDLLDVNNIKLDDKTFELSYVIIEKFLIKFKTI